MKYGRFIYRYTGSYRSGNEAIYNIGDNIQTYAIDYLYKQCGINGNQIIDLNFTELMDYEGEYVIVPMAGYLSSYKEFRQLPVSSKIIPYFISSEFGYTSCDEIAYFLKKWEPIGARDEASLNKLKNAGIEAYLSGCLTLTLPKRAYEPHGGKVFLVDVSDNAKQYIPEHFQKNAVEICHVGRIETYPMTEKETKRIDMIARQTIERYQKEAVLVITSRLHAAAPCIAFGIPTIIMCDNVDHRFSWIDKIVPLYDSSCYDSIDWHPKTVDIEDVKQLMKVNFINGIERLTRKYEDIANISDFWENRIRFEYDGVLKQCLKEISNKFSKNDRFRYGIWGAGAHGAKAHEMMQELYPKAELSVVVDKYICGNFCGCSIVTGNHLKKDSFDYMIISTSPGRYEAKQKMEEFGYSMGGDYCYFISQPKQAVTVPSDPKQSQHF